MRPVIRYFHSTSTLLSKVNKMGAPLTSKSDAYFLGNFYKKSDDPEDHNGYADFFTDDATLVMGLHTFKGRQGFSTLWSIG
jgi:hypothetical protein